MHGYGAERNSTCHVQPGYKRRVVLFGGCVGAHCASGSCDFTGNGHEALDSKALAGQWTVLHRAVLHRALSIEDRQPRTAIADETAIVTGLSEAIGS